MQWALPPVGEGACTRCGAFVNVRERSAAEPEGHFGGRTRQGSHRKAHHPVSGVVRRVGDARGAAPGSMAEESACRVELAGYPLTV